MFCLVSDRRIVMEAVMCVCVCVRVWYTAQSWRGRHSSGHGSTRTAASRTLSQSWPPPIAYQKSDSAEAACRRSSIPRSAAEIHQNSDNVRAVRKTGRSHEDQDSWQAGCTRKEEETLTWLWKEDKTHRGLRRLITLFIRWPSRLIYHGLMAYAY